MRYSTIRRDSNLLEGYGLERKAVAALDAAFAELKKHVLMDVKKQETRGPRGKLLDVVYTLVPSPDFVAQMKAANKRQMLAEEKGRGALPPGTAAAGR